MVTTSTILSSNSIVSTTIILNAPRDWEPWYDIIKTKAKMAEVWQYIDPNTTATLEKPLRPQDTTPGSFNLLEWANDTKEYNTQKQALLNIGLHIENTVSSSYSYTIHGETTARDMLTKLESRIAPKDLVKALDISSRFMDLCKAPTKQRLDQHITDWERLIAEAAANKHIIVEDSIAVLGFLTSIRKIHPEFAIFRTSMIQEDLRNGTTTTKVYDLIDLYRDHLRLLSTTASKFHGAFSTQADQVSTAVNQQGQNKQFRQCPCGKNHYYSDCYYLNKAIRPVACVPVTEIESQINGALKNPGFKAAVKRSIAKRQQYQKQSQDKVLNTPIQPDIQHSFAATYSVETTYLLGDSFILDSGSDIHICNNRSRFTSLTKVAGESWIAGNSILDIIGFGAVPIHVTGPNGAKTITLLQTAYIPTFNANLVSLRKLRAKGVHWNSMCDTLELGKEVLCSVSEHHSQYTLEYNPVQSASSFANSHSYSLNPATPEQWHQRLGHPREK